MNQYDPKYTEKSITYWPYYEAGRIGIIFLIALECVNITLFVWLLFDHALPEQKFGAMVFFAILTVIVLTMGWLIGKSMYTKITISADGIEHNTLGNTVSLVRWNDVETLLFVEGHWQGGKSCRIWSINSSYDIRHKGSPCDYVLPVSSVDEKKLLELIPAHVRRNPPW